jgi:hypothetical protein
MLIVLAACVVREPAPGEQEPPDEQSGSDDYADDSAAPSDDSAGGGSDDTADGGSLPGYCQEVSRVEVHLDDVPKGFTSSPRSAIEATAGTWAGTWDTWSEIEDPGSATMVLTYNDATVHVVDEEYVPPGEDDDWGSTKTSESCVRHYAIPMSGTLDSGDGSVAEAFDLTLEVPVDTDPIFAVYIPLDDVVGSDRPTAWNPSKLSSELIIVATVAPDEARGRVVWATTGRAELPSKSYPIECYQMVDGVADFALTRAPEE